MAVLERIAFCRGRRDEVPNQELARDLARAKNKQGIQEIAENLWNKNRNVQSDCLKVLYEIGYIDPELICGYVNDFLELLQSRNNRLVWGGMIALSTVSKLKAKDIWARIDDVLSAVEKGSLITVVSGVRTLAGVASTSNKYRERLFPFLVKTLRSCTPRDVPTHAESILPAVDESHREKFLSVLKSRLADLTPSQANRLKRIIRQIGAP